MLTSLQKAPQDDQSSDQLQVTVMRAELAALIDRLTGGADGVHPTAVPRLALARASQMQHPVHAVYDPAFCIHEHPVALAVFA